MKHLDGKDVSQEEVPTFPYKFELQLADKNEYLERPDQVIRDDNGWMYYFGIKKDLFLKLIKIEGTCNTKDKKALLDDLTKEIGFDNLLLSNIKWIK